jgi:hypothetical protein
VQNRRYRRVAGWRKSVRDLGVFDFASSYRLMRVLILLPFTVAN